jgi:hypothetical protein
MDNLAKRLSDIHSERGEETFELIAGIYSLTNDLQKTLEVIEKENFFDNYYLNVKSFKDLAEELLNDEILWEDKSEEELRQFLMNTNDEIELKNRLMKGGWKIASTGMAICLCEDITPPMVYVEIEGGMVQTAYSNIPGVIVDIIDIDNEYCSDDVKEENEQKKEEINRLNFKEVL